MRKLFNYLKILFKGIEFGIRYSYQCNFANKKHEINYLTISILSKPFNKVEYFIFDESNPIIPLMRTSVEKFAKLRYKELLENFDYKLIFIKVENMEIKNVS